MLTRRNFVAASAALASNPLLIQRVSAQTTPSGSPQTAAQFTRLRLTGRAIVGRIEGANITPWSSLTLVDALIGNGHASGPPIPLKDAELLPNIDQDAKILCMALNFVNHAAEAKQPVPESPLLFFKSREAMIASSAKIEAPDIVKKLDYEGELAFVIGKTGYNIPLSQAWDHVAGVAAFNDTSARDLQDVKAGQRTHLDWFSAKCLNRSTPVGAITPVAHILDDLKAKRTRVMTRVNGEERQNAPIADMVFDIPQIIAFVSTRIQLSAGDVIATGTPPGVGFATGRFLKPGDRVDVEISGLPILSNFIA